jgi:uncharacterized membrane protein YciS (DUF1049 family)
MTTAILISFCAGFVACWIWKTVVILELQDLKAKAEADLKSLQSRIFSTAQAAVKTDVAAVKADVAKVESKL